ncbi:MAG: hypothetical protein PHV59_06500, partial [Victivallales bacterium]|nr:hypothetical protein [Victivallales bacterium]
IPFGGNSPVKLKKILTGRKLTATEKENLIVMRIEDGSVIWIPQVRHSGFAAVSGKTAKVALIKIETPV